MCSYIIWQTVIFQIIIAHIVDMTSLRNVPPSISVNQYDVIVIGNSLSGLTAAAFLAQAGARLLVCEQAALVGGMFNSFQREGYQFDGGIKAVENSSVMMPTLAQLGLLEKIEFQRSPIALLTAVRLQPIMSFANVAAYFQLLGELFPDEQTSLQHILGDTKTVLELLNGMLSRLPRASALMNKELSPYLEQQIRNPGLVNLLSDLFPDGTSAFFGLGYFRMFLDYYYPHGGIRTIPQTLAHTLEAGQGEIRLNTRVEQILLKDGQARGIRLVTGVEIFAGFIIAASDLRWALTRLLPEGVLPSGFDHRLRRAGVSHSVLNVFLGVNRSPESLNLNG
jgi:phytoene dehydrogenase-like protein